MMSKLTQLRDEAARIHTVYVEYKDSDVYDLRRKVHLDLDRFLMQHREEAILMMIDGLDAEINKLRKRVVVKPRAKSRWLAGLLRRRDQITEEL